MIQGIFCFPLIFITGNLWWMVTFVVLWYSSPDFSKEKAVRINNLSLRGLISVKNWQKWMILTMRNMERGQNLISLFPWCGKCCYLNVSWNHKRENKRIWRLLDIINIFKSVKWPLHCVYWFKEKRLSTIKYTFKASECWSWSISRLLKASNSPLFC